MQSKDLNIDLLEFIHQSPTPHFATKNMREGLIQEGYIELFEKDSWHLEKNKGYFITKNSSAIIAFKTGTETLCENGYTIIASHTDSPCFKVKPNPELLADDYVMKINTEGYGGQLLYTWFDRPLSMAGMVYTKSNNGIQSNYLNIQKPIMIIPSLAMHMQRQVNDDFSVNKQKDTLPILGFINNTLEKDNFLMDIIAKDLGVNISDILDFDLFLYDNQKGEIIGYNNDIISSARLDDLWLAYTSYKALINSNDTKSTKVFVCVDDEEIGSSTAQGGNGAFIMNILRRIAIGLGEKDEEQFLRACVNSKLLSADSGHGKHPNAPEKNDPTNVTLPNKGMIVKFSTGARYATNGYVSSLLFDMCERNNIPLQRFIDRSDTVGGSTIGPMLSNKLTIPACDIGMAMWGMHSIRETGGALDTQYSLDTFTLFYNQN